MSDALLISIGILIGAALVAVVFLLRRGAEKRLAEELARQSDEARAQELAAIVDNLKTQFAALSREALSLNTDDFLKLARTQLDKQATLGEQKLDAKKELIDARLKTMGEKLIKTAANRTAS
jgi:hypothetical protein